MWEAVGEGGKCLQRIPLCSESAAVRVRRNLRIPEGEMAHELGSFGGTGREM